MALNAQERRGVLILVAVGSFVAAVIIAFVWQKVSRPYIGPDNCVYQDSRFLRKMLSNQTVIIVDQSEELSASHKRQVKELLLDYIADDKELQIRSTVMLYVFGKNDFPKSGAGQDLRPVVNLCKPPASGNEVFENKRKLERTFRDKFVVPLYRSIDASLERALGERSPILEMLQYISRTQDIKEIGGSDHRKTMIVVSDLLQHSSSLSHYKGDTYQDFLRSAGHLKADLRGWHVRIIYLQRYGKDQLLQAKEHKDFWMQYFHEAGAKLSRVELIP